MQIFGFSIHLGSVDVRVAEREGAFDGPDALLPGGLPSA